MGRKLYQKLYRKLCKDRLPTCCIFNIGLTAENVIIVIVFLYIIMEEELWLERIRSSY